MEKGNQPAGGDAAMQADGGGTTATATRGGGTSTADPRFINEDGSPKTPGQLRDEALAQRIGAESIEFDLGTSSVDSDWLRTQAAEMDAHADALEQGQMLGAGSTGAPTTTRGGGTSTTDPRFINEDGSPKTPGQLRDEALAHRASADAAGGDLGGGIRSSFLGWAAEFEAHADALEQGQMLGAGSTGAPTTDSGVSANTPDGLRQQGRDLDSLADGMQSRLDASIASGDVDADQVAEKQAFIDKYREQATKMRATADAPPPEAAHTGPTGEVVTEDGTRRGVDESGRPYEADASGDQSDRERFDKFGPPGASTK